MQINHKYTLLSDSSLISVFSCYSLNPCFCSRSWSFYFCCWQLIMFSRKFEILIKPFDSCGLCSVFYNESHLAFHCTAYCWIALSNRDLVPGMGTPPRWELSPWERGGFPPRPARPAKMTRAAGKWQGKIKVTFSNLYKEETNYGTILQHWIMPNPPCKQDKQDTQSY